MDCKYLLRFDDIAPNMNWRLFYKIKELLIKYKIKPILGVIPNNKDKELKNFQFVILISFQKLENSNPMDGQ